MNDILSHTIWSCDLTAEELALTPYAILNIFQWEYLPPKNNPNKFSCLQWGSHRKFYTSHEHFICLSELRMLMILPWYFFWYQMGIFWPHLSIHEHALPGTNLHQLNPVHHGYFYTNIERIFILQSTDVRMFRVLPGFSYFDYKLHNYSLTLHLLIFKLFWPWLLSLY